MLLGSALQAAAGAIGPIVLVQPILIGELAFVLVLTGVHRRTPLRAREWLPIACLAAGVTTLMVSMRPTDTDPFQVPGGGWVVGCAATVGVVALLVRVSARMRPGVGPASLLGVAAGAWFGFSAVLMSAVTSAARHGALFITWQIYGMLVAGPLGFFLLQNMLRAGPLVVSQPGLTLASPLVAVARGLAVSGEQVRDGVWVAAEVVAAAVIVVSTVALARSALLHPAGPEVPPGGDHGLLSRRLVSRSVGPMRAIDIMSRPVVTVIPDAPAKEAARILAAHGFTALPVVDDERLVGIVTEADLIGDRVPPDPRFPRPAGEQRHAGASVGEVMSSPATAMAPGCDLATLSRALLDAGIRAMPIADGGRVVGIVTRGDIVRVFARSDREIAADVRRHLSIYGGPDRWQVDVCDGVVRIADDYDDETDRHVATLLAEAVPGVVEARTVTATGDRE